MRPSGVSRLVARLEAQLGVHLLTRSTRRVELTDEAAALMPQFGSLLAAIGALGTHLTSDPLRLAEPAIPAATNPVVVGLATDPSPRP